MSEKKPLGSMTPEAAGLPSGAVMRFLDRIAKADLSMHSFILIRRGKIITEGYWKPFDASFKHRLYSSSKSFASLGVGILYGEGKIKLTDKIASYFPEYLPENPHPYIMEATIRDLLMMSTPYKNVTYVTENGGPIEESWIRSFFTGKPDHIPGTLFFYDTTATTVLTALVEKLSGKKLLDFLREKALDEVGFSDDAWCIETPEGVSWAGSGIVATTRDFAKAALLCLNHGGWNGKQLISEEYMRAATTKQINVSDGKRSFGWNMNYPGYGYQFWVVRENGFAFRGLGSQEAFAFPDKDFLFVCTGDTQGDSAEEQIVEALYNDLLPFLSDEPLPENREEQRALAARISSLELHAQPGEKTSPWADKISGVKYELDENTMGIHAFCITIHGDEGKLEYTNGFGPMSIGFGLGKNVFGKFPQENYFYSRIGRKDGIRYDCAVSAAWVEEHKLLVDVRITDVFMGNATMVFSFKDDRVAVLMDKSAEWFLDEYKGTANGRKVVFEEA